MCYVCLGENKTKGCILDIPDKTKAVADLPEQSLYM